MRKSFIVLFVICLLFSNTALSFAANEQEKSMEAVAPPSEAETADEGSLETETPVVEEIQVDQDTPSVHTDVVSEILSDLTVTANVHNDNPRSKFLIRVKPNYSVSDSKLSLTRSQSSLSTDKDSSLPTDTSSELDTESKASFFNVRTFDELNTISMELSVDDVNQLLSNPLIESIEEDKPIEIAAGPVTTVVSQPTKNGSQTISWGIHSTGSYIAQSQGSAEGSPIKVAVFDTGISDHSDLQIAGGVSYVENVPDYRDDQGHGTHIAGTIAALNNDLGVVGVAPGAQLYSVKVLDASGIGYTSAVLEGIQWAIENGINIINMSFTSSQPSAALHSAIQLAHDSGIMVVAAAGNTGAGENTIQYPAQYPEVIAVGAVDQSHHRAGFSSTGNELDFVAPGFGIISTMANGEYGSVSGTSNAAAHVTGAAAWVWSRNPSLTSNEIIQMLASTATSLGPKNEYGHGLINIAKAMDIISGPIAPLSDENLSGLTPAFPPREDGEFTIASYDKVNDGATVETGSSITVSLKLQGDQNGNNPHSLINVQVYSPFDPDNILLTYPINNPQLNVAIPFTWNVNPNLPTGTYHIKYQYPALPSGTYDDIFVIYVIQPGGPDTYEPNNTTITAKAVAPSNNYISYISSSSDVDYYRFQANNTGKLQIDLQVPPAMDYELSVLDNSGNPIAQSSEGAGAAEHLNINVAKDQYYYVRVIGYSGAFSSQPYTLSLGAVEVQQYPAPTGLEATSYSTSIKLIWEPTVGATSYLLQLNGVPAGNTSETSFTFNQLNTLTNYTLGVAAKYPGGNSDYTEIQAATAIPELIVNHPEDIDSAQYQLYSFKPATTGVYRIYTGGYGGSGSPVDTELGIYTNQQLSKLIASNDDANNTVFSEIVVNLVGGQAYYVKISGYDVTRLRARVTAEVVSSTIPYIQLNRPVDINQQAGNSNVYVFVPSENGQYRMATSPYNGNANSGTNDTELAVFADPDMESPVTNGYNDDKGISVYSEVVVNLTAGNPYYVRVTAAAGSKVHARLLVTEAGPTVFAPLQSGVAVNLTKSSGEEGYFKFTPSQAGSYRFFTNAIQGSAQLNDTEISIYADPALNNLIDSNDDAKGYKPYGELFSKLETYLNKDTTYYLVVGSSSAAGLNASFAVEDTFHSSLQSAMDLTWEESYETDSEGRTLQITSLYDANYFKVQLDEAEQVSFYLSDDEETNGEGTILDINGNVKGYFGQVGNMDFNLAAGVYYLRVEHAAIHDAARTPSWNTQAFTYEISVSINEIIYTPGTYGETSVLRMLTAAPEIKTFDATPGSGGNALVYYQNKKSGNTFRVEIYTSNDILIRKYLINQAYNKGDKVPIRWFGTIDSDLYNKNYYANSSGNQYWAKSGTYEIVVTRMDGNKRKSGQSFNVTVFNDPFNKLNAIPLAPKLNDKGKPIKASDLNKCELCVNYFDRYVYSPSTSSGVPTTAYEAWFGDMYGKTGLRKFWAGAERLVACPPSDNLLSSFQCTLDTIGMIPVLGEGADAINGVVYLIRGDYANALLSGAAIIPVAGAGFTGAKKFNKIFKYNPCGCLPAGTIIKTKNGEIPIEDIKVGDLVLAKNTDTGIQSYKPVEQLYAFDADLIYTLEVAGEEIRTTSNHPFWVDGKGWTAADELSIGDRLETEDLAFKPIENIRIEYAPSKVYNFTVGDYHTYYIAKQGFLTHNLLEACRLDKYSNLSKKVTTQGSKPAVILRAEITKHTGIIPPSGWEAHHIVAKGSSNIDADKARKILDKYKIEYNSSANGVFLPTDPGNVFTQIDGQTLATHNGGHTKTYYKYVYDEIFDAERLGTTSAEKEKNVLEAIGTIRNELLTGVTAIGKVK